MAAPSVEKPTDPPAAPSTGTPVGRRVVLGMLGLGAVGIVAGARIQNSLDNTLATIQSSDPTGLSGLIPVSGGFRYYSITDTEPDVTATNYRLSIGGLVDNPSTLDLADLQALPQTSLIKDFQCVTGWRVPKVHWTGVLLRDLLDHAQVGSGATAIEFTSLDGAYTESLTLSQAQRSDVIVATTFQGGPISRAHGGPVRLYVAPMYGYKSIKWLGGIELTRQVEPGYWEQNGYDVDAWIGKSNGRDDAPV